MILHSIERRCVAGKGIGRRDPPFFQCGFGGGFFGKQGRDMLLDHARRTIAGHCPPPEAREGQLARI